MTYVFRNENMKKFIETLADQSNPDDFDPKEFNDKLPELILGMTKLLFFYSVGC